MGRELKCVGNIDEAAEAIVVVSDVAVRDLSDQHVRKARWLEPRSDLSASTSTSDRVGACRFEIAARVHGQHVCGLTNLGPDVRLRSDPVGGGNRAGEGNRTLIISLEG